MQTAKLSSNPLLVNYAYSCNFFNLNSIYGQSLRWKRKPLWLPTAKSKVFRVPARPVIPKDEAAEIQRLYNNYRTYLRSVRAYFKEVYKKSVVQHDQSIIDEENEADFKKCFEINEEWNKKIASERKIFLQTHKENRRLQILQKLEEKKIREEKMKAELDAKVKLAKLMSPTFITRDNIDKAIEEALENIVDYNKALWPDGTWYTDKSGLFVERKSDEVKAAQ